MALRHIFCDAFEYWRAAILVLHHPQREAHIDQLTVASPPRHLHPVIQLTILRRAHKPLMIRRIGVDLRGKIKRQQFFAGVVAEQFEHCRIRVQHALVAFSAVHAVYRAPHQRIVVRTGTRQRLLCEPSFAHVARDGDVASHRAITVANDRYARLHPDRGAIGATKQPCRNREPLASRHLLEQHHGDRALLRRHQRGEVLADECGERKSEQLLEICRSVGDDSVRIDGRNRRFKRFGKQPQQIPVGSPDRIERRRRGAGSVRGHQLIARDGMKGNLCSIAVAVDFRGAMVTATARG